MKNKTLSIVMALIFLLTAFCFAACGAKVENVSISFIVDGEVYDTVDSTFEKISLPTDPIKEGYTFDGWYWDEGVWQVPLTVESLAKQPLKNQMKVYARFIANKYKINFKVDGEIFKTDEFSLMTDITIPDAPKKEGLNFVGWFFDEGTWEELLVLDPNAKITNDITVYALYIKEGEASEDESSKTTLLRIRVSKDALGTKWIGNLAQRFEETYADLSFEDGRKGVKVLIDDSEASVYMGNQVDLMFASGEYSLEQITTENSLLDLTEIITEKYNGKSIEDKLNPQQIDYYKQDDKYYALPHYETSYGIVYDVDLFNEKGLFFKKDGGFGNLNDNLTVGKDGVADTYDDGLPITYADFFALCDKMVQSDIIPMTGWNPYVSNLAKALWADYSGVDNGKTMYNGVGKINSIQSFTSELPNITVNMSLSDYSDIATQAGLYYSFDFINKIYKNKNAYLSNDFYNANITLPFAAQRAFISSKFGKNKPIGMLIEGPWWQNESAEFFDTMASTYGESALMENRRFGFMSLPKPTADCANTSTMLLNTSNLFANANSSPAQQRAAKEFIKFANTDEELRKFTAETSVLKGLNYQLTDEDMAGLTYFTKNFYIARKSSEILYDYPSQTVVNDNFKSSVYTTVMKYILDSYNEFNKGTYSGTKDYFEELSNAVLNIN